MGYLKWLAAFLRSWHLFWHPYWHIYRCQMPNVIYVIYDIYDIYNICHLTSIYMSIWVCQLNGPVLILAVPFKSAITKGKTKLAAANHHHSIVITCLYIISNFLSSDDLNFYTQFLLDWSVLPETISCHQIYGDRVLKDLFYLTQTWCLSPKIKNPIYHWF